MAIARLTGLAEREVRKLRHSFDIRPAYQSVDTCAAEFPATTPYLYSSYQARVSEAEPTDRKKVIILGSGPNRIGQGIEFDYCCVHASWALRSMGIESIMINCNPETVSTDYDTSDRLYFEPLVVEHVMEIIDRESSRGELLGVIVQLGGQTPLKLVQPLVDEGVKLLGTSADSIAWAEDRQRFSELIDQLELLQPRSATATSLEGVEQCAEKLGYPLLLRPSYVLGGRAMAIVEQPQRSAGDWRRRRWRSRRDTRCWSINSWKTRWKWTWTAWATDNGWSSPGCSSISRKPACIRATRPAFCHPTRSAFTI